jgi:hypothetical protein
MSVIETAEALPAARSRRSLFKSPAAGLAAAAALGVTTAIVSEAATAATALTDADIFNFALNFEYIGAEYYLHALFGYGLDVYDPTLVGGTGTQGPVIVPGGSTVVPFSDTPNNYFAFRLANDELSHVRFIRAVLGEGAIARPTIDFTAFTPVAQAAGLITAGQTFNPFLSETGFLLGAYLIEDTCVTALAGAASQLQSKTNLSYAAGLLGVESQQAGAIRGFLAQFGMNAATDAISALRAQLSGVGDEGTGGQSNPFNISNGDIEAQAFRRTPQQILAIAFGGAGLSKGAFFPAGVNASNTTLASS